MYHETTMQLYTVQGWHQEYLAGGMLPDGGLATQSSDKDNKNQIFGGWSMLIFFDFIGENSKFWAFIKSGQIWVFIKQNRKIWVFMEGFVLI